MKAIGKGTCLALFAALFCLTGCIGIVPVPHSNRACGRPLHPTDVCFIRARQTTRADVVTRLGTNCVSLPGDRALAYQWEAKGLTFDWFFVAMCPYGGDTIYLGYTGCLNGSGWKAFMVSFDTNGVVTASGFRTLRAHVALHQQLEDWTNRQPPAR